MYYKSPEIKTYRHFAQNIPCGYCKKFSGVVLTHTDPEWDYYYCRLCGASWQVHNSRGMR